LRLSTREKLNHYAPWNKLALEKIGSSLEKVIARIFKSQFGYHAHHETSLEDCLKYHKNGAISIYNGLKIEFNEIPLEQVLLFLARMAGQFENSYRKLHGLYSCFHKKLNSEEKKTIENKICCLLEKEGFYKNHAYSFAKFIVAIQPTFGQLLKWRNDLNKNTQNNDDLREIDRRIAKYEKLKTKLINYKGDNEITKTILEDQIKNPTDDSITQTWPVHASFCYLINDYRLKNNNILVRSIHLYPEFVTTESGTEKELGAVLRRPI